MDRPLIADAVPDIGLHHAVASVRIGGRVGRRLVRCAFGASAVPALLLWVGWSWLRRIAAATSGDVVIDAVGNPIVDQYYVPYPSPMAGVAANAAMWLHLGATFFTILAIVAVGVGLMSPTPTHKVVNGRLKATKAAAWKSTGPGHPRIKPTKQHLSREARRAKKDVARTQKTLARLGARRREHWARQHAAEDWARAEHTKPGRIDQALMDIKPKAKRRKAGATSPGQKRKPRGRQHRQQLDQDYEATAARLAVARLARTEAARPRLDPDAGPPVAPGAGPSHVGDEQRERLAEINARVDAEAADQKERAAAHVVALLERNPDLAAQINAAVADVARREWEANGHDTYTPPPAPTHVGADQ